MGYLFLPLVMNTTAKPALSLRSGISDRWLGFIILAVLALTWGSSFILIKKSLIAFDPVQVASLRLSITALALSPVVLQRYKTVTWSRWPYFLAVGLLGTAIPAFLFSFAQQKVSSSVAGMLNTLTPLFTLLLGIAFFQSKVALTKIAGVLLGLSGAAVLIFLGQKGALSGSIAYSMLIVLATVCYGANLNMVASFFGNINSLTLSAVSFSMVGIPAIFYLLLGTDFISRLSTQPQAMTALGYVAVLSLGGTVIASVLFFWLVQRTSAIFSSTVAYLMPIVALVWGVFDGEAMTIYHLAGVILIMAGVYLSRR
jgi:drug/metabolite transporter (DMT)-like permease